MRGKKGSEMPNELIPMTARAQREVEQIIGHFPDRVAGPGGSLRAPSPTTTDQSSLGLAVSIRGGSCCCPH
jgi:hypothetical protein